MSFICDFECRLYRIQPFAILQINAFVFYMMKSNNHIIKHYQQCHMEVLVFLNYPSSRQQIMWLVTFKWKQIVPSSGESDAVFICMNYTLSFYYCRVIGLNTYCLQLSSLPVFVCVCLDVSHLLVLSCKYFSSLKKLTF